MRFLSISPTVAIALNLLFLVPVAAQNATCYWPDGSVAIGRAPCLEISPGAESFCCGLPSVCTTGGYCLNEQGVFVRSSCTDPGWHSAFCPQLCAGVYQDGFAFILPCNPGVPSDENWVCGDPFQPTVNFCNTSSFNFIPGGAFEIPEAAAAATPTPTPTSTVTVTISGTTSPSSTATASTPAQPQSSSCPSHKGTIIGIGAGLGVGLGLSTIAALSALFVERRKHKSGVKAVAQRQDKMDSKSHTPQEAGSKTLHEIGDTHRYL